MRNFLLLIILLGGFQTISAQVIGKWKTIDDETGEPKSIVTIYEEGNKIYGKVVEILNEDRKNAKCEECETDDPRYMKPIQGMVIIKDLEKNGDGEYGDGTILDPENGSVYRCKIWREGKTLKVRGYLAFLYRTQTWYPVN
ncbi:DUF2147 domain-containing protein [Marinigracilibium pacificum]|uniref:DUF2147 domain-containing protein n=1 Tax=Marinigracilibium pacificum TaxID=2729599 RepID=A0A848J5E6_9BACT|nr:DUF2147 domain-containing protein [Marinigracilibium pacificum]NMM50468.1 DUF2147 domain-containing protein [Marinigracilibium pacificum]